MSWFRASRDSAPAPHPAREGSTDRDSERQTTRWIRSAVLVAVPLVLLTAAAWHPAAWRWTGFGSFRPLFLDTTAVLAAGMADASGADAFAENPFDPLGRPHVYGPWWLALGRMGMDVGDAGWVGLLLGLLFLGACAVLLAPRSGRELVISAAFLGSAPVLLAIQRGNNDLAMFLLLVGGAWLLSRPSWWSVAGGALSITVAAALKMYPAASLLALLAIRPRAVGLAVFAGAGVLLLSIAAVWSEEYLKAVAVTPRPDTVFAYGWKVIEQTWSAFSGRRTWLAAGTAVGVVVVALAIQRTWRFLWVSAKDQGFRGMLFVTGASSWCFCFAAASSFPYRAVLLLTAFPLWLRASDAGARWQLVVCLTVVWLQPVAHLLAARVRAGGEPDALLLVCGVEQGMLLGLTAALAIAIAGAVFQTPLRRREAAPPSE